MTVVRILIMCVISLNMNVNNANISRTEQW